MGAGFDYSLDREAVAVLLSCSVREQRFLTDAFSTLARFPAGTGDFAFRAGDGRENQIIDLGGFVVTFWTDHAVKVVRILAIERV